MGSGGEVVEVEGEGGLRAGGAGGAGVKMGWWKVEVDEWACGRGRLLVARAIGRADATDVTRGRWRPRDDTRRQRWRQDA